MLEIVKKIVNSRWLRLVISGVLIYWAFRKVNIANLISEIGSVPLIYIIGFLVYLFVVSIIGGMRWSILLLEKPTIKDFWIFTKATYRGSFYGLFFPTAVAGDLLKWMPLKKEYPEISKTKIASSVIVDRIVGLFAFTTAALIAMIVGKFLRYQFPDYLLYLFILMSLGMGAFFVLVNIINFEKVFGKWKLFDKLAEAVSLLKHENKKRLVTAFVLSMISEPIWQIPYWFYSLIFGTGISLLQVLIFMPVISLILVLPISIAGFGARENLILYFFSPLGFNPEKLLIMSTFAGIMGIFNSLLGGLFLVF